MITSTRAILKLTSVRFQATNSSNGAAPPDSHNLTPPPPPPPPPRTSLLSVPKPSWIVRVCVSNMIRRDMKVMLHLLLQKERGVPQLIKNQNEGVVPSVPSVVEGGPNREVGLTTSLVTKSFEENQGPVKEQPRIQNASLGNDKLPNDTGQHLDIQLDQGTKKYSTKKGKRKTISCIFRLLLLPSL